MQCVTMPVVKPKVLAPGMYAIDVEPISPRNRNNREVHLDYLKYLKESVEMFHKIVEEARIEKPLDNAIENACFYTKRSQELNKQVSFKEICETSNNNTQTHVEQQKVHKTNVPVIPSKRVNSSTEASRSKPRSNTKNNRILPAKRNNKKNTCNKCLISANHDKCVVKYLKSVRAPSAKTVVSKVKQVVQIVLWYLDSGCSKHMTGNRSRLKNFVKKFIGIVRFGNDHFGAIMGYGDYVIGDSVISRHCRLNYLNVGTINDLARKDLVRDLPMLKFEKYHLCCSACQLGKSKKYTHKPKSENTIEVLHTLHMDLCGPMRVQSINGKKYILVVVDDYSRFTWVKFLRSKDKTLEFVIKFLKQIQVGLNKTIIYIRTDNGTEFVNQLLIEFYKSVSIFHQKSVPRNPQQNGVVERQNRTLVEAARTMLIFSKA
ncbi:retrovirus-related pol polyprotein from transposon TNT 1-94, partial [Tanacetum coccineum]